MCLWTFFQSPKSFLVYSCEIIGSFSLIIEVFGQDHVLGQWSKAECAPPGSRHCRLEKNVSASKLNRIFLFRAVDQEKENVQWEETGWFFTPKTPPSTGSKKKNRDFRPSTAPYLCPVPGRVQKGESYKSVEDNSGDLGHDKWPPGSLRWLQPNKNLNSI